jgi:hypothetical protein
LLWSSQDPAGSLSAVFPRPHCGSKFISFVSLFVQATRCSNGVVEGRVVGGIEMVESWRKRGDLSHETTWLSHGSVLFLESLTKTLGTLDELVDAAHGATLFLGWELGRGEVVDAVLEAALDKVAVHLGWYFSG